MDKFREDMIEIRQQMEKIIDENSEEFNGEVKSFKGIWSYSKYIQKRHTILRQLWRVTYDNVSILSYFSKADIEKQRVIVETLLNSSSHEVMERLVIRLLNCLEIETKEQLNSIFNGIENLLTENIERQIRIELKSSKIRRNVIKSMKHTALWATIFIIHYKSLDTLAKMNMDYIAGPLLFGTGLFLVSSLIEAGRGVCDYKYALKDEHNTQKQM